MKCIFCEKELVQLVVSEKHVFHSNTIINKWSQGERFSSLMSTHNCKMCDNHIIPPPPIYAFYYPTCLKKDLDIIRIWGNIFIAKLMLKDIKTHVWKHSDGTFQTVLQVKSLLNINPENIDSKVKSLLVFT